MSKIPSSETSRLAVNTIRMMAVDGVEKANSGHPGLPMGAANYAFTLWSRYLRFNPQDPAWPNRDRFILSAGHGSMLLYTLLHLAGFDLPLAELQRFRQWESKTPGHPEYGVTPGVETTTGPLGAGFSNGVGMAIAAKMSAARYNTAEHTIVDHYIYGIVSDGDLMEGVASEAASLAGHLKLGNIIYFYDDNRISIEGSTDLAFTEERGKRFEAYGWQVLYIDGHDCEAAARAIEAAQQDTERPSLIIARTHIAMGSPNKVDTAEAHGAPLGAAEVQATKKNLGWPDEPAFYVPDAVRQLFKERVAELKVEYTKWQQTWAAWAKANPELAAQRQASLNKQLPDNLEQELLSTLSEKPAATRRISGDMIQKIAALVPGVVGGSADLAPSTSTLMKKEQDFSAACRSGRNLHFGVREHGMGGIVNGIALYGGFIPYGATFLVFADYMRPTLRLASIMGIQSIFIFTHDSIFVGEDGPTHEPIEQIASLRAIPRMTVIRPADGAEVAAAWAFALRHHNGPTALILSRQNLPVIQRDKEFSFEAFNRGGYVVSETAGRAPDVVLVGTGSELQLAVAAKSAVEALGLAARVVSMPSVETFLRQDEAYRRAVITPGSKRVVIEAGIRQGWDRVVGSDALFITQEDYGHSAPAEVLAEKLGFTPAQVSAKVVAWLKN
ncbi:MAG: transketolase [Chloroflexi bacterium]|nr:transketolase [Chloroflexota bacterium]